MLKAILRWMGGTLLPHEPLWVKVCDYVDDETGERVRRGGLTFLFDGPTREMSWFGFVEAVRAHEQDLSRRWADGDRHPCVLRRSGSGFSLEVSEDYWLFPETPHDLLCNLMLREILVLAQDRPPRRQRASD